MDIDTFGFNHIEKSTVGIDYKTIFNKVQENYFNLFKQTNRITQCKKLRMQHVATYLPA